MLRFWGMLVGFMWLLFMVPGADEEAEKLCLSNELFDAAAQQDPLLVKRDLGWVWIDLEDSWAGATDSDASITCKKDWACLGGTRWDFILGCPQAATALRWCWVDGRRWIQPHLACCLCFI